MIIYLMLLTSVIERAALPVLGLQQVGLPRFTPARLCGSQVMLIQNLLQTPHAGKEFED